MNSLVNKLTVYFAAFFITSVTLCFLAMSSPTCFACGAKTKDRNWIADLSNYNQMCLKSESDIDSVDNFYCDERGYLLTGKELERLMCPPTYF